MSLMVGRLVGCNLGFTNISVIYRVPGVPESLPVVSMSSQTTAFFPTYSLLIAFDDMRTSLLPWCRCQLSRQTVAPFLARKLRDVFELPPPLHTINSNKDKDDDDDDSKIIMMTQIITLEAIIRLYCLAFSGVFKC